MPWRNHLAERHNLQADGAGKSNSYFRLRQPRPLCEADRWALPMLWQVSTEDPQDLNADTWPSRLECQNVRCWSRSMASRQPVGNSILLAETSERQPLAPPLCWVSQAGREGGLPSLGMKENPYQGLHLIQQKMLDPEDTGKLAHKEWLLVSSNCRASDLTPQTCLPDTAQNTWREVAGHSSEGFSPPIPQSVSVKLRFQNLCVLEFQDVETTTF